MLCHLQGFEWISVEGAKAEGGGGSLPVYRSEGALRKAHGVEGTLEFTDLQKVGESPMKNTARKHFSL